jgi:predicted RNA-binding protein with PUA-like domain
MPHYWLIKQEPAAYSWDQFVADGKTDWTGVRSYAARIHLRAMKIGDKVLYYHSVTDKAVVGIAKVTKESFPDPTATEGDWSAVELQPIKPVAPPVTLEQIKAEHSLAQIALLRQSRLSVMNLSKIEYETILSLNGKKRP